jgi:predicted signal transduction protein with EAL and GGDEF domain
MSQSIVNTTLKRTVAQVGRARGVRVKVTKDGGVFVIFSDSSSLPLHKVALFRPIVSYLRVHPDSWSIVRSDDHPDMLFLESQEGIGYDIQELLGGKLSVIA